MPSSRRQPERELAQHILGYFLRNPRAADDLEGVVRWRLLDERVHLAVEDIHRALEWLVSQGYLETTTTDSAGRLFSLHAERRREAEQFMSAPPAAESVDSRGKRRS